MADSNRPPKIMQPMPPPVRNVQDLQAQSIQALTGAREWMGTVVGVDLVRRRVDVNTREPSGPRYAFVAREVNLGTQQVPLLNAGDSVLIREVQGVPLVVNSWSMPMMGMTTGGSTGSGISLPAIQSLPAPLNFSVVQVGDTLYFSWDAVPTTIAYYEIYSNTIATPVGATLFKRTANTSYSAALTSSINSNIITNNPGFESGSLTGWTPRTSFIAPGTTLPPNPTVVTSPVDTGNYSAQLATNAQFQACGITSDFYNASPGITYVVSMRCYQQQVPTFNGVNIVAQYYDANKNFINQYGAGTVSTDPVGSWFTVASLPSYPPFPANTAYARVDISIDTSGQNFNLMTAFIDNISLMGISPPSTQSLVYAVRAVGQYGAQLQASAFTEWKQPVAQPVAWGNPLSTHLRQDYSQSLIQTSNYIPDTGGSWNLPTAGYQGALQDVGIRQHGIVPTTGNNNNIATGGTSYMRMVGTPVFGLPSQRAPVANQLGMALQLNWNRVPAAALSGAYTVTGFANGYDGKVLFVENDTSQVMTLANQSASSAIGNRISTGTGANVTIGAQGMALLVYDSNASAWQLATGRSSFGNNTGNFPFINVQADQTNSTSDTWRGIRSYLTQSAGGNTNPIIALDAACFYTSATGNLQGARGGSFTSVNTSTGTITMMKGTEGNIEIDSTGAVTTAIQGDFENYAFPNTGVASTITTAYGIRAGVVKAGGGAAGSTITTGYGVYIDTIGATTKWGLYQSDATANNFIAGNVGLGVTPNVPLDVSGSIASRTTDATQLTANTNDYNPGVGMFFFVSSNAAVNVTGLANGVDGRVIILVNTGAFAITLTNQDVASAATNRLALGASVAINSLKSVCLVYRGSEARWRIWAQY